MNLRIEEALGDKRLEMESWSRSCYKLQVSSMLSEMVYLL